MEERNLGRMLALLLKKSWLICLAGMIGMSLSLVATFYLVVPQYRSTVTLYVTNVAGAQELAECFAVIVKMRGTLLDVIKYTGTDRGHQELREMIDVVSVNGTDFFELTVSCPDPYEAERFANAIGELLPTKVAQIMDGLPMKMVDEAVIAAGPSAPHYPSCAFLGAVIGITLAVSGILLWDVLVAAKKGDVSAQYAVNEKTDL